MRPPRPTLRRISTLAAAAGVIAVSHAAIADAKITSAFGGQILTVHSGKHSDRVAVGCGGDGLVKINGRDPAFGQLACSVVADSPWVRVTAWPVASKTADGRVPMKE